MPKAILESARYSIHTSLRVISTSTVALIALPMPIDGQSIMLAEKINYLISLEKNWFTLKIKYKNRSTIL